MYYLQNKKMNKFKVLVRKSGLLYTRNPLCFADYMNHLTLNAKLFPGFIRSESYWENNLNNGRFNQNYEDKSAIICTISDWKTSDDWYNWYNSEVRAEIKNEYLPVITDETFSKLYKNDMSSDIFLL